MNTADFVEPVDLNIPDRERAILDKFVEAYFVTYDYYQAALTVGYVPEKAAEFAKKLQYHPYVIQKKNEFLEETGNEKDQMRRFVVTRLQEEALAVGSGSARVAALQSLAKIHGLEPPKQTKAEVNVSGEVTSTHTVDFATMSSEQLNLIRQLLTSENSNES